MKNWITLVNELNPGLKFIVRVVYPIIIFVLFYTIGFSLLQLDLLFVQVVFLLFWAFIEWRIFLSYKNKK